MSRTEFDTVDGYVAFVVEQVLNEVEESEEETDHVKGRRSGVSSVLSKEEQKEVEERLKGLGYL